MLLLNETQNIDVFFLVGMITVAIIIGVLIGVVFYLLLRDRQRRDLIHSLRDDLNGLKMNDEILRLKEELEKKKSENK